MATEKPPLFPPDWPGYARAAHVAFWTASAALAAACLAAWGGYGSWQMVVELLIAWIGMAGVLGVSALCSARLYAGNQVFSREPMVGWPARMAGGLVVAGAAFLLWIVFGLAGMSGR